MATPSYWERLKKHNRFPDRGKIKISMDELQALVEDAHEAGVEEGTGFQDRLSDLGKQVERMIAR